MEVSLSFSMQLQVFKGNDRALGHSGVFYLQFKEFFFIMLICRVDIILPTSCIKDRINEDCIYYAVK